MTFAEKILTLRKGNNLTQEELAEKVNVSRQSVSKWESGQAIPELEKIVALSAVFHVTTDTLLKSSELDDLSVKTEILEKQQEKMLIMEERRRTALNCVLYSLGIYFLFIAMYFVGHFYFEIGNPSIALAGFLTATAIVIFGCLKIISKHSGAR